jgi:hypothetical protein
VDEGRNIYGISLIYIKYMLMGGIITEGEISSLAIQSRVCSEGGERERVDDVIRWRITAASILCAAFFSDK